MQKSKISSIFSMRDVDGSSTKESTKILIKSAKL